MKSLPKPLLPCILVSAVILTGCATQSSNSASKAPNRPRQQSTQASSLLHQSPSLSKAHGQQNRVTSEQVHSIAFSPDGKLVAVGFRRNEGETKYYGVVQLWNAKTQTRLKEWRDGSRVNQVAFSPDGKTLFSATEGVRLWQVPSGKPIASLSGAEDQHLAMAVSPDGRTMATGGVSGLQFWDLKRRKLRYSVQRTPLFIVGLAISPDGRTLASTHNDIGTWAIRWNLRTGKALEEIDLGSATSNPVFSPDGTLLAGAMQSVSAVGIKVWSIPSKKILKKFGREEDDVRQVALSSDGRFLADNGANQIRVWDMQSGKLLHAWPGGLAGSAFAFSPDGRMLVTTEKGKTLGNRLRWLRVPKT